MVYSFAATGDFAPTFISENVKRVLGYCPDEYLKNADFWRARVHPDDLAPVEAEQRAATRCRGSTTTSPRKAP